MFFLSKVELHSMSRKILMVFSSTQFHGDLHLPLVLGHYHVGSVVGKMDRVELDIILDIHMLILNDLSDFLHDTGHIEDTNQ